MSGRSTSLSIISEIGGFAANSGLWLTENKPFRTIAKAIAPFRSQVGIAIMNIWTRSILAACLAAAPLAGAQAGVGDLLVAPTRIVLDGRKGAEIILNNIGSEPATYRVSIEFRRMTEAGELVDVTTPTPADQTAE